MEQLPISKDIINTMSVKHAIAYGLFISEWDGVPIRMNRQRFTDYGFKGNYGSKLLAELSQKGFLHCKKIHGSNYYSMEPIPDGECTITISFTGCDDVG